MPGPYDDLMNYGAQPDEEPSWIRRLASSSAFAPLQWIGESLGKPQQALYGLLDGDVSALANLIPFSDTLGITGHAPGEGLINTPRRSGQDMLRKWGVIDSGDSWGNWGAGLALDLAADPLAFASFGAGALTKAGQAAKMGGTLEKSLLGRVTAAGGPQGGLMSLHAPWYAQLMGASKDPMAVLGTGKTGEVVGQGLRDATDAATRWTIPGTDFSPVASLRSKFQPFTGFTGTPEYVQAAAKNLEGDTTRLMAEGTGRTMPFGLQQSDALNALAQTGMKNDEAAYALWRAGISKSEVGEALTLPNLNVQQQKIISDFADQAAASRGLYDTEANLYRQTGGTVPDVSTPAQNYERLQVQGYGNKLRGPLMERTDLRQALPYGSAQFEEYARDPAFSGIASAKQAGVPYDQAAVTARIAGNAGSLAQDISQGWRQRFGHLLDAQGNPVGPLSPEMTNVLQYADVNKALKPAGEIADYLARLGSEVADKGYFKPDLAAGRISYAQNFAKLGAGNLTALQTLANEARPLQGALTAATDTRSVTNLPEALKAAGLADSATPELMTRLQAKGKTGPLDQLAVDSDLARKIGLEVNGPKSSPPNALSKLAAAFRYGVTVPWPANLTRNWGDTLLQQGLAGDSVGKNIGTAVDYFRGAITDPAKLQKAQAAFEAGFQHDLPGFRGQLRDLTGVEGLTREGESALNLRPTQGSGGKSVLQSLGEQFAPVKNAFSTPGVTGKVVEPAKEFLRAMEGGHNFQNKTTALQQMMNLLDEGWSPAAAAEKIKVDQLDYSRLTPFMRDTGRTVVPFANFSMQNLGRTANLLQQDPGRLNAMLTAANSGRANDQYVPPYVSGGAAVPIPGAPEGKQRFLSSFGIPMEDEAVGSTAALLAGHPLEAARRLASSSNPAMKTLYEMATGTQIFSGRPLADLKASGTLAALLGDNPFSRGLAEVAQGTPASRLLSTSDRLLDTPSRGVLSNLLNLGTGVRVVDTDTKMASEIAAREALQTLLKQSGQFKSRESVYLDKNKTPDATQLPPELQDLLLQYQAMERRSQEAAKARAGR